MRVFSNGPSKDFVVNPFTELLAESSRIYVASPFVTKTEELLEAAKNGKRVDLLVGLNTATSPEALSVIHQRANVEIRYYTNLFHGKIYLFDNAALVGSSNLTDGGMKFNREATIRLDEPDDIETIEELRTLFAELWDPAPVLTTERLKSFTDAYERFKPAGNPDALIGDAVGRAEPPSMKVVNSRTRAKRIYLERLRRQVSEYRTAFNEVQRVLEESHLHRPELQGIGAENQTNLFLNWVRLTYAPGDDSWKDAPLTPETARRGEVLRLGREWTQTNRSMIANEYFDWLHRVHAIFGAADSIDVASEEELTDAILSIHAFHDRSRFTKGGVANLPTDFWKENGNDVVKVKRAFKYLIYGGGEFIERLHDVRYDPVSKLKSFGLASALELYGTVKPADYPPVNGRIAKALRYLGFNVRGGVS